VEVDLFEMPSSSNLFDPHTASRADAGPGGGGTPFDDDDDMSRPPLLGMPPLQHAHTAPGREEDEHEEEVKATPNRLLDALEPSSIDNQMQNSNPFLNPPGDTVEVNNNPFLASAAAAEPPKDDDPIGLDLLPPDLPDETSAASANAGGMPNEVVAPATAEQGDELPVSPAAEALTATLPPGDLAPSPVPKPESSSPSAQPPAGDEDDTDVDSSASSTPDTVRHESLDQQESGGPAGDKPTMFDTTEATETEATPLPAFQSI
jgi:hypothetical protein